MTTTIEALEREAAILLDALDDMCHQCCHKDKPDGAEPGLTDSGAITAQAEALQLLAERGRFRIVRGFGRMICGYFPEDEPESSNTNSTER